MASFLLPSSIQKRLLRYALSRLELLDTDALDLEHLDISWGTRSTLEFRNVGLRLKKFANLLQLPSKVDLAKARILLLRVTIPVDIYSSPIVVEVDGVEAHIRIISDLDAGDITPKSSTNRDRKRSRQDEKGKKRTRSGHDPSPGEASGEEDPDSALPTAVDLAKSFLQTEAPEKKAELEAAMLQKSENLEASLAYTDDGEEEYSVGTGTSLSLPAFMANFLRGIVDRLQVRIHGISLDVDIDLSSEGLNRPDASPAMETVTIQLRVDDVDIEGVTFNEVEAAEPASAQKPEQKTIHKDGKRRISLRKLRGALISDPSLFASMARSSAFSSPSVGYSPLSEGRNKYSNPASIPRSSSMGSTWDEMALAGETAAEPAPNSPPDLSASIILSDNGRFEDAVEDETDPEIGDSVSLDAVSDPRNSFFSQSVYLDQVADSHFFEGDVEEDDETPPFAAYAERISRTLRRSPLSTPRASVYMPPAPDPPRSYFDHPPSYPGVVQSTMMSNRPRQTFAEFSASRSQPLPGPGESVTQSRIADLLDNPSLGPSLTEEGHSPVGSDGSTPLGEDELAQSMIFSHEEAESMYMSALSQGSASAKVPGAWDPSPLGSRKSTSISGSPTVLQSQQDFQDNLQHALRTVASGTNHRHSPDLENSAASSRDMTPTDKLRPDDASNVVPESQQAASPPPDQKAAVHSSAPSNASSDEYARVAKQIFNLDQVAIYVPSAIQSAIDPEALFPSTFSTAPFDGQAGMASSTSPNVPGAFSVYAARQRRYSPHTNVKPDKLPEPKAKSTTTESIEIILGRLEVQFDISVARLIARLMSSILDAISTEKPDPEAPQNPDQEKLASPNHSVQFRADRISLKFLERLTATTISSSIAAANSTWIKPQSQDVLLRTTLKGLDVSVEKAGLVSTSTITLQKFVLGYAKESIISFNANFQTRASTRDLPPTVGVDLTIKITRTPNSSHFKITTLPVHVAIDLRRLDETFSWFGGLSSVLNMGSSMASNATVTLAIPTKAASKPRSVRFEAPSKTDDTVSPQFKLDGRVGGFVLDLVGRDCTIGMDTTAVKIVGRDEVIGLSIDKIKISGPHLRQSNEVPAILAELGVTRVQFMSTPKNDDLEKLLSLITPSKAKYDRGDDILLDTLLRQRRQGSVLRIAVDSFSTQVKDLEDLKYLPELGEEVSRLSTVAKYLPEDDRPGLLTLIIVRDVDVHVSVDEILGSFNLRAGDFEAAHITFPALLALSVDTAAIHRNKEELLGAATDIELRKAENRSPAIMARMIGDEMEPVVKIKLWNLRVEYSVPLVIAILGLSGTPTTEEIVESIAASVATLTDLSRPAASTLLRKESKVTKDLKASDSKPMTVDIGIQECILALNPMDLSSKVLVVMTEAHVSAVLPKDNNTSATFELAKGSLLVIDNVKNILPSGTPRLRRRSFDGGSTQVADLCSTGFVSVSYISSAKAIIQISNPDDGGDKCIDVELRDDLLVLESCADSTQTLVATLNGLKPPTPPSKEIKYRTTVIPVQDLLASLSGDAFGTAEGNYDFDEDFGPGLPRRSGDAAEDEENSELDFDSHYYQEEDSPGPNEADYEQSRDRSVLFDQLASHDTADGVLLESFQEQEQVHSLEELNFHEDHFGGASMIEGTAHRWNSAKNTYERANDLKARKAPLRVCVRDVHIIWNLFDGYDWQRTRDAITKAVDEIHSKAIERRARNERRPTFDQDIAEEETVIGDFLFNSIYIGIPANRDPRELANAINQELNDNATETESVTTTAYSGSPSRQGGAPRIHGKKMRLRRSKHHKITFELKGVSADLVAFHPGSGETESSIDVRVHDFDIFDHVPTSTWKKFATYMHDAGERESGTSQIHLEILNVKPIPELAASEIVLKATVLPLRLHVDQDALDFITRFFEFKDDSAPSDTSAGDVPFLQRVEVNSIPVKLDFKPKRVDYAGLRSGHTTEFMNFIVLDEADMVLRHTIIYGISGFDKLGKTLNDIWMPDIKHNQLPGILAGLAPVRSLANVGGGVRDLVVIPMREYRKDGRIVRSISKGAISFARTTGTELVKLGAKLAIGTQTVLQGAEEFLSKPGTPSSPSISGPTWEDDDLDEEEQQKQISAYADQPTGVVQGLRGGYASLERDLLMARDAIIAVPGEVMESGNAQAAVGVVLRRAPTVILRPVMGVTKALGQTLMGATNSLDPQNRRRVEDKYKKH